MFLNVNSTLLPPNSIVLGYGFSIVNVTTLTSYHIISDYQTLGVLAFCEYIRLSGNVDFANAMWSQWQLLASWIPNQTSPITGLPALNGGFLGPGNSSAAISCVIVYALNKMADIAIAVLDNESATIYRTAAEKMARNINERLWNSDLGVYSLSESSPSDYSINGVAFCILSGVANATQAKHSLSALDGLRLGPGYRDSTLDNANSSDTKISPNTNGFLLEAIASQNASIMAKSLMESLWTRMIARDETTTGASWEYVSQSGDPGLGLFTSLGHPWGGAPTYILPEYVTGVQTAVGPEGFGYKQWTLKPQLGLDMGLDEASSETMTVFGKPLKVS